jgi:hypothetical protein
MNCSKKTYFASEPLGHKPVVNSSRFTNIANPNFVRWGSGEQLLGCLY